MTHQRRRNASAPPSRASRGSAAGRRAPAGALAIPGKSPRRLRTGGGVRQGGKRRGRGRGLRAHRGLGRAKGGKRFASETRAGARDERQPPDGKTGVVMRQPAGIAPDGADSLHRLQAGVAGDEGPDAHAAPLSETPPAPGALPAKRGGPGASSGSASAGLRRSAGGSEAATWESGAASVSGAARIASTTGRQRYGTDPRDFHMYTAPGASVSPASARSLTAATKRGTPPKLSIRSLGYRMAGDRLTICCIRQAGNLT